MFEPNIGIWQYIVADPNTKAAVIIDSVLDYNPGTNALTSQSAEALLAIVYDKGYKVEKILETHVHADHITASKYLQRKLAASQGVRPDICIGKRVKEVQERFGNRYGVSEDEYSSAFDHLLDDDEKFSIGDTEVTAMHLPGHTPDHLGYVIGCKCPGFTLNRFNSSS